MWEHPPETHVSDWMPGKKKLEKNRSALTVIAPDRKVAPKPVRGEADAEIWSFRSKNRAICSKFLMVIN